MLSMAKLVLLLIGAVPVCLAVIADPCLLKFESGPCEAIQHVITFDSAAGRCVPAQYGGCQGNENRFTGITECESVCSNHLKVAFKPKSRVCTSSPLRSNNACFGIFPRFTFNSKTGSCEAYMYGGCNAGDNLFLTHSECVHTCIQQDQNVPRINLSGRSADSIMFPDSSSETDEQESEEDEGDVCSLPPVISSSGRSCMALIHKWTFSKSEGKCVEYTYGGCFGTANLFDTEAECRRICTVAGDRARTAEVCSLPIKQGPCRGYQEVFGFNMDTGRCEQFVYGGCQGNANAFDTVEECVSTCGGSRPGPRVHCDNVKCDNKQASVLRAKGCVPITAPGGCCPSKWDCSTWENRLTHKDQCFAVSEKFPRGKLYLPGESMEDIDMGCSTGCFCTPAGPGGEAVARPTCAIIDCAPPRQKFGKDCVSTYSSANDCCERDSVCGAEKEALGTCRLDGKTYVHGQKMYPKSDPCLVCFCQLGWTGELSKPFCKTSNCGLFDEDKLIKGCQPIYSDGICCPTQWVCPDQLESIATPTGRSNQGANPVSSDLTSSAMKQKDRCMLPVQSDQTAETGDCSNGGSADGFYFDQRTGSCHQFRGCLTGLNSFNNRHECNKVCEEFLSVETIDKKDNAKTYPGKNPDCEEPVVVGNCRSRLKKYWYDVSTGECHTFFYSGCQGGKNMFDELRDCVHTCVPVQPKTENRRDPMVVVDPCTLDQAVGPCRAYRPSFFFNKNTHQCESFMYSGCQGNANRFDDLESCEAKCGPGNRLIQVGLAATLPQPIGGFNPAAEGCPGCPSTSEVTPEIRKVAEEATLQLAGVSGDGCDHPPRLVRVEKVKVQIVAGTNYFLTLRMDTRAGPECKVTQSRVCDIVAHKPLPFQCQNSDTMCIEIIRDNEISCRDVGTGRSISSHSPHQGLAASFPQPIGGFNPAAEGCPGCPSTSKVTPEIRKVAEQTTLQLAGASGGDCDHPPRLVEVEKVKVQIVAGTNYFLTLRMDTQTGPGCQVTQSRVCDIEVHKPLPFRCQNRQTMCIKIKDSSISCRDVGSSRSLSSSSPSSDSPQDPCLMDKQIGRCKAAILRHYFDKETSQCKTFRFGGCGANGNNFVSASECEKTCAHLISSSQSGVVSLSGRSAFGHDITRANPTNNICSKPMDAGMCMAIQPRFFYNPQTRHCEEFIYGGCGGNENNFPTMEECVAACGRHPRSSGQRPVVMPAPEDRCYFGKNSYAVGDVVRMNEDPCTACVCSSPPQLSCAVKSCPHVNMPSRRDMRHCRVIKDDLGCCTERIECPTVTPRFGGFGGSFPGGAGSVSISPRIRTIADRATSRLLTQVSMVTGAKCDHASLVNIIDAKEQVVAGMNYIFTLHLRAKQGPLCKENMDRFCKNITVFQPLPHACQGNIYDCMQLIREDQIECFESEAEL